MSILLLSPILTTYIPGHDIVIYLCVLSGFCIFFIFRSRDVISKWNTWLLNVPSVTDKEVLDWYINTHCKGDTKAFENMTAPAALNLARSKLYSAVYKERSRPMFSKSTKDKTVRTLAEVYPTTVFLLDWYSSYAHADKPLPYTSTWNLETKVALNTLRGFDKGLRLHNAFIHWRHAKHEIAHGTLYFLLALLDRWIELLCGGRLVGLSVIRDNPTRIAIGLGLVYYLFGAVALDIKVYPLYDAIKNVSAERLRSASHLNDVAKQNARNLRRLYWRTLAGFIFIHVWGLAVTASVFWVYVEEGIATVLLLLYLLAYTGLLWFQYNKIFAGRGALQPILLAVLLGFAIGLPLRLLQPDVFWNDVLALAIGCWVAGVLSFAAINLRAPHFEEFDDDKPSAHSQKAIGPRNNVTADQLNSLFKRLESLPEKEKHLIALPSPVATEIHRILKRAKHSPKSPELKTAFPGAFVLLDKIVEAWDSGFIVVHGVSQHYLIGEAHDVCAVSCDVDGRLKIYVALDDQLPNWNGNLQVNCYA